MTYMHAQKSKLKINFMRNFLKLFGLRTVNRNYFVLENETKYSIISINY